MAASNPATVFFGVLGGLAGAAAMFYSVASGAIFPRYTPPDQNDAWQTKSEDLMVEGKWVCFNAQFACLFYAKTIDVQSHQDDMLNT